MAQVVNDWDPSEPERILDAFTDMLWLATGDGATKRQAGLKPSWEVDNTHEGAFHSHLMKWKRGELVDPESLTHPLVHAAWRLLAIAWQESQQVSWKARRNKLMEPTLAPDSPDGWGEDLELCLDATGTCRLADVGRGWCEQMCELRGGE